MASLAMISKRQRLVDDLRNKYADLGQEMLDQVTLVPFKVALPLL